MQICVIFTRQGRIFMRHMRRLLCALVDAAEVKPGMKVLKVDGHTPGDGNYPLHY
jgi:hypothetical protein